jgi:hypothetical protein
MATSEWRKSPYWCKEAALGGQPQSFSKEAKSRPVQSIETRESIIVGDKEGWAIPGWEQCAKQLLKVALESDNPEARDLAVRVINIIGSRGQYGFRDLLRKS